MTAYREMPKYQCHKQVWALKIKAIARKPNPDPTGRIAASSYGATITPSEDGYGAFDVSPEYMDKHQPQVGGYYVVYEDGYKSYSPAAAFESGYSSRTDAHVDLPVVDPGPDSLEQEIQAKADKGPRVTPAALKDEIASAHYFTGADGVTGAKFNAVPRLTVGIDTSPTPLRLLTFCVLVLRNGFTVHGVSACASPENYNKEIGERIARENAEREIWPLLGFRLRDELSRPVLTDADAAADLAGTPRPDNPTAEAADFLASVKACDLSGDAPCEACQ